MATKPVQPFPNFGKYLTYQEAVKSTTAIRRGIRNQPTAEQYANLMRVYKEIYVPITAKFGKLPVSSMFRSAALNKAIGGSTTSAHLSGLAIDIDCDGLGYPSNKELYEWVKANLTVDQVIAESPNAQNIPSWVHVGLSPIGTTPRQQCLIMVRQKGKTIYLPDTQKPAPRG